jgi:hypothetical protein
MKLTQLYTRSQVVDVPEHFVEGSHVNQSNIIYQSNTLCGKHVYPVCLNIEQNLDNIPHTHQVKLRAITRFRPLFFAS